MQPSIFISYKREDESFARRLHAQLKEWGYPVWLDVLDIPAGSDWDSTIHHAMQFADIVIGVLTPASLSSRNVLDEWGYALSNNKRLFLLWFKDVPEADIPPRYIRIQRIDFRRGESIAMEKLKYALLGNQSVQIDPPSSARLSRNLLGFIAIAVIIIAILGFLILQGIGANAALVPTSTDIPTPTVVASETSTSTPEPSRTPTLTLTNTEIPSSTPTELPTLIPTVATPTDVPTATSLPLSPTILASTNIPVPTSTVGDKSYPCSATITSGDSLSSELNVVHSQPKSSSAIIRRVQVGSGTQILDKVVEGGRITWYQITNSQGSAMGWVSSEYLNLSNQCP